MNEKKQIFLKRLWKYQGERFPLVAHGILIATMSASALMYSASIRGEKGDLISGLVAFVLAMMFYLQLRIADEFKDFEEDSRYRPYRPVPRGLVTLAELSRLFIVVMLLQLLIVLFFNLRLMMIVLPVWLYLGLMTKEFFVHDWLKRHHVIYMLSHMVIVSLIDLNSTACDWIFHLSAPAVGLLWFPAASYFNGMVFELGRKMRPPEKEEKGVETYTALWGARKAVVSWLLVMFVSGLLAVVAAEQVGAGTIAAVVMTLLFVFSACAGWKLVKKPGSSSGKVIEGMSVLWALAFYAVMGIVPALIRMV